MAKRALVTGITGQDGAYLSQLLLNKGYEVLGVIRRSSHRGVEDHRLRWLGDRRQGDPASTAILATSRASCASCKESQPDEIYNLAAQSFVASSWRQPILTGNVTARRRRPTCWRPCASRARTRASIRRRRRKCSA